MNTDPRRGFKLIELMVVIFIFGVMCAIFVRGVGISEGVSCRSSCQNNMRQVGLGLLGHLNAKGAFPNAGTFFDDPAVHGGDPTKSSLLRAIQAPSTIQDRPRPWLRSWVVDILPYIDSQELYNAWNMQANHLSSTGMPSNLQIATTAIGILRCPEDESAVTHQGNLSYVVNGGFARWYPIPISWNGSPTVGSSRNGETLRWTETRNDWARSQAVGKKLGVMFLGTHTGDQPWDIKTSPADLIDGAGNTLMVGENSLAGYTNGTLLSGGVETNWACPLPNFCMFLGSDDVCRSGRSVTDCLAGQLAPMPGGGDGEGWYAANQGWTFENINHARAATAEGSFPYANSRHPGGSNFLFCDGAVRYINETVQGSVYAKFLTPAGEALPQALRQQPLTQAEFGN
ncbi:DUF1559 family PulG-like putative transporter [Singulisphaera rosea]